MPFREESSEAPGSRALQTPCDANFVDAAADRTGSQELITLLANFFRILALLLSALGSYGLLSTGLA